MTTENTVFIDIAEKKLNRLKSFNLTKDEVLHNVSFVTKVPITEIEMEDKTPGSRRREIVFARHMYCYMSTYLITHVSLQTIADRINKDHASVIHGKKSIRNFLSINDKKVTKTLNAIINNIVVCKECTDYVI